VLNPLAYLLRHSFLSADLGRLPFAVAPVQYQMTDSGYSPEATVGSRQAIDRRRPVSDAWRGQFRCGDYVKAGSVIVRLSAQELSSAAAGSQAQVAQAAATLANATRPLRAQQQLFQRNSSARPRSTAPPPNSARPKRAARAARAGQGNPQP